ncbi:MAG TPA: hypothetical protein VJ891_05210 [Casimicrobiaceae bacterium]|nr:hypothetical protein [Casimicrobiaceae bacterium]
MITKTIGSVSLAGENAFVNIGTYERNARKLAVVIEGADSDLIEVLSVNTADDLGDGEFVVAVHHFDEESLHTLFSTGLFIDTGRHTSFGFVNDAPIWKLAKPEGLEEPCDASGDE